MGQERRTLSRRQFIRRVIGAGLTASGLGAFTKEEAAPCVMNAWFEPPLPARVATNEWVEGTLTLQNIFLTPLAIQATFSAVQGEIRFSPVAFAVKLAPEETFKEDFRFRVASEGEFSFNAKVSRQDDGAVCRTLSHSGVAMTLRRVFLPFVSRELQAPIPTPTPGPIVTPPPP